MFVCSNGWFSASICCRRVGIGKCITPRINECFIGSRVVSPKKSWKQHQRLIPIGMFLIASYMIIGSNWCGLKKCCLVTPPTCRKLGFGHFHVGDAMIFYNEGLTIDRWSVYNPSSFQLLSICSIIVLFGIELIELFELNLLLTLGHSNRFQVRAQWRHCWKRSNLCWVKLAKWRLVRCQ